MKQTCLCNYLGVICNHPDTLLHIPTSIRRRIYFYAGVISGTYTAYPYIGKLDGDDTSTTPAENYDITYNLMSVCQQIRKEVEAIILSQNTLVYIDDDDVDEGLYYLSKINAYACSMLRDIYIHLHVQPSSYDYNQNTASLEWKRIDMWESAMTNILSHTLFDLARETALHVQGQDPNVRLGLFRFFDLPAEIRRNVFEYTSLVAPHRKVHWCHEVGFRSDFVFCECNNGTVYREEDIHHERNLNYCGAYSKFTGSFCMNHQGSYSSRCSHALSPLSLLLTCRAMYEEAIDFFYSSNRVVILPDYNPKHVILAGVHTEKKNNNLAEMREDNPFEEYPRIEYIKHDNTKLFVDKVGPKVLKLIRNLEIVFPRISPASDLSVTHLAYEQWCLAVDSLVHLAAQAEFRGLTLAVHIWTVSGRTSEPKSLVKEAHLLATYAAVLLLKPLHALPQLDRLFVHLQWPQYWSPPKLLHNIKTSELPKTESPGCGIGLHFVPLSEKKSARTEISLEKMVMGPDYDSYSMGKGEELPIQWVRAEWDCW